jgi:anthranilate phosphoribosyltransferase
LYFYIKILILKKWKGDKIAMINSITLGEKYSDKEDTLNSLAKKYDVKKALKRVPADILKAALDVSISQIDNRIRLNNSLSIEESLSGMLRVVAATNNEVRKALYPLDENPKISEMKGAFFLTRMAAKEQYIGLTPEELAGITMGGMVDLVYCPEVPELTETSGMGADRGWDAKKIKTINASTLSALLMTSLGYPSIKHGSYGNTTKVGSTDVPEQFGARINQKTEQEILKLLKQTGFWFNDAHAIKTIHYISHLLMVETINHIVGPMTPPIAASTKMYKIMGVNHYVHPETVAKAYTLLHKLGVINLGGAVILSGVRKMPGKGKLSQNREWFGENAYLDEASTNFTMVSCAKESEFLGTTVIDTKKDLGIYICEEEIKVPNQIDSLMKANQASLEGKDPYASYLALNGAYTIATHKLGEKDIRNILIEEYQTALNDLRSGNTFQTLIRYVRESGGAFHSWN